MPAAETAAETRAEADAERKPRSVKPRIVVRRVVERIVVVRIWGGGVVASRASAAAVLPRGCLIDDRLHDVAGNMRVGHGDDVVGRHSEVVARVADVGDDRVIADAGRSHANDIVDDDDRSTISIRSRGAVGVVNGEERGNKKKGGKKSNPSGHAISLRPWPENGKGGRDARAARFAGM